MGKTRLNKMSGQSSDIPEATPEQLSKALKDLQEGKGSGDFKMTKDEANKIESCFKEPEFRDLFKEYMDEMADPKHRSESDQYLRQLEGEGNVPEGMAMCSEGICIKAKLTEATETGCAKVFINVTHCTEIAAASQEEATDENGKKGKRWKLPFSLSPSAQIVEDHSGEKVQSWDVAVNSGTFEQHVRSSQRFCDLLVRTAIDDIKRQFNCPIDPESYKVLKKRKYMGGKPVPMNLGKATKIKDPAAAKLAESISATMDDKESKKAIDDDRPVDKESPSYGLEDEIDEIDESAASSSKPSGPSRKPGKSAVPKGFLNNKSRVKPQAEVKKGPIEPEFSILHQSDGTQLEDAWNDEGLTSRVQRQDRPTTLSVRIALPGLESVAAVDLDITERELVLETEPGVVPQYQLKVNLPYPVDADSDQSSAKWVSDSQVLFVTLPVLPAVAAEAPQYGSMADDGPQLIQMLDEEEEEEEEEEEAVAEAEPEPVPAVTVVPEQKSDEVAVEEEHVEVVVDGAVSPKWEFHDNRMNATLLLKYEGVPATNVRSGMNKEGMAIQFWSDQKMYSLAINTYAPIIPTWSRVKITEDRIEVILAKAQPGSWDRAGKESTVEAAGVTLGEWPNDAAAEELKMHEEEAAAAPAPDSEAGTKELPTTSTDTAGTAAEEEDPEDKLFSAFTRAQVTPSSFIASVVFEGRRPGYVFTTRDEVTGYYIDNAPGVVALDDDEESCPEIGDVEEEGKNAEGQSGWQWLQDARAGSEAGSTSSGDAPVSRELEEPEIEEKKQPRFQKQKFEAGFMERPKKPTETPVRAPIDTKPDSAAKGDENAPRIWSPTQIKIENRLVLELD